MSSRHACVSSILRSKLGPVSTSDADPSFSDLFPRGIADQEFDVGTEEGNQAYFGRDVLRGSLAGSTTSSPNDSPAGAATPQAQCSSAPLPGSMTRSS